MMALQCVFGIRFHQRTARRRETLAKSQTTAPEWLKECAPRQSPRKNFSLKASVFYR
jgi:hypothetical protein